MSHPIISPKKLIEVALPLDAINAAAAAEKGNPFLKGHPRNLHQWWARRPMAAARAVIFSQLVNDPEDLWRCQNPGVEPNKQVKGHWTKARARLFRIIEELVLWENTTNEEVLEKARDEIRKSWREVCDLNKDHPQAAEFFGSEKLPGLLDPFAGGGAIPLEAQRLGLDAFASDLNPVAVLINKALIELPPQFADMPPVNSDDRKKYPLGLKQWKGASGLAHDIRYYGKWIRSAAENQIGEIYPKVVITRELAKERPDLEPYVGCTLSVTAWLWARTVESPSPAHAGHETPLVSTFVLCSKKGKESWVLPIVDRNSYSFVVKKGPPPPDAKDGTKVSRGANFNCLLSGTPIEPSYIKAQAIEGKLGTRLLAIVAEGKKERVYLSPLADQVAASKTDDELPDNHALAVPLANDPRNLWCLRYGLDRFDKLFTDRQRFVLCSLARLATEASKDCKKHARQCGFIDREESYANTLLTYLSLAIGKLADYSNTLCAWNPTNQNIGHLFTKQAIPMTWDFVEANLLDSALSIESITDGIARTVESICANKTTFGSAEMGNAVQGSSNKTPCFIISTDPPYYDNVAYADLSDFFYVWHRFVLRDTYPSLFATMAVPKTEELVANPYRHGSKEAAESFFLDGMTLAMSRLATESHPAFPITIYYAFKQSETKDSNTGSTGWETFLEAVLKSGLAILGTWPMRTERSARSVAMDVNSLASSIILTCRRRPSNAERISRRDFIRKLNSALPIALDTMTRESEGLPSPVAPVDLSQAIIGPGMAIFSKYSAVLEADGTPMSVRTALQLINRFLAEDDFDADTQFCLHWFDGHGWDQGVFGEADVLARAKATSVNGLVEAGVLRSGGGKVQLLRPADFSADWNPEKDHRIPIWEVLHQLIRALRKGGETEAGILLSQPSVQSRAEAARQLAYRLYTLCERKGWAEDARAYNELVTSWSAVESNASREPAHKQGELF